MPKPPPASTRNPAFQSKLEPYREFIRECRAKRWSYPRIATALREDHGLSVGSEYHFLFRQSSCQATPPLCAAALGRTESRSTRPGQLQGAGVLQPAGSRTS